MKDRMDWNFVIDNSRYPFTGGAYYGDYIEL